MGTTQASATTDAFYTYIRCELDAIEETGLYKTERIITSPQGAVIRTADGKEVINLCANNYLGLSSHPEVLKAAHEALDLHGFGLSSIRFICGVQDLHKTLEARLTKFLGAEDTTLYGSTFDASGGLFEMLLGTEGVVISDELNHASIIDGIHLCKAQRYRYKHNDLDDLRAQLQAADAAGARFKLMFADGVFSMDDTIARLDEICAICGEFGALLGIDECHATGFFDKRGRGSHEHRGVFGKVDIITGTLDKGLGDALGGFTNAREEVVAPLRQRSRPYLFSNTVAPCIVGTITKVLGLPEADTALRDKPEDSTLYFRRKIVELGFDIKPGDHPIVPIMVYDAQKTQALSKRLLELGVYVVGFFYPVVPKGQARIRVRISVVYERAQLDTALKVFETVDKELGIIW